MSETPPEPSRRDLFRFSVFELDGRTGELRKSGARVRLSGQPLKLLERLIARPGDLVTRDELQRELWSDDTFVDFERNLNTAIKRLRQRLEIRPTSRGSSKRCHDGDTDSSSRWSVSSSVTPLPIASL